MHIGTEFPLCSKIIQRQPIPVDQNKKGVGDIYRDDLCPSYELIKIRDNTFLLEDSLIILWDGSKYTKKNGDVFELSEYIPATEKVLAVGMSEYGILKNEGSKFTHMQTTDACPCIILILRSNTETELYHITIQNESYANDILEFVNHQGDETFEDIDDIEGERIKKYGISAYLYQGEYEQEMKEKVEQYESMDSYAKLDFLASLSQHEKEYVEQYKKYGKIKDIFSEMDIQVTEGKKANAKIRLTDGEISFPDSTEISCDLGTLVLERAKNFGNDSAELKPRQSNILNEDNYGGLIFHS